MAKSQTESVNYSFNDISEIWNLKFSHPLKEPTKLKKALGPIPTGLCYIASFLLLFSKYRVPHSNDLQLELFVKLLTCRAVSVIPAYTDDS